MPKHYESDQVLPPGSTIVQDCTRTSELSEYIKCNFSHLNPVQTLFSPYIEDDDLNIVISAPTSSGKTLCAEYFIARAIKIGKKAIYIAPMKALADEKYSMWSSDSHSLGRHKVEILTGDFVLNDAKRKALEISNIIIMTPEMFNSKCRFYMSHEWMHNSVCVADEIQIIGSRARGDKIETGLIQFFENSPDSRIMFLSATIPNVSDFSTWVENITKRKTKIIESNYRPCKLTISYRTFDDSSKNYYRRMSYEEKEKARLDKVVELCMMHKTSPMIVFVGTKNFGRKLSKRLEDQNIKNEFHNADLTREDRQKIENGFRNGDNNILIATSTVSWGINSSARYVILSHTTYGMTPMETSDIIQSVGRAGRLGYANVGDAIIVVPKSALAMEKRRIEDGYVVHSTLNDVTILMFHILSYIVNKEIKNAHDLYAWYEKTFAYVQKKMLSEEKCQLILENLEKRRMIKKINDTKDYEATILGDITARMYMSPLDVSDWYNNFSRIGNINPKSQKDLEDNKIDIGVSLALSQCYSWDKSKGNGGVYISKAEASSEIIKTFCNDLSTKMQINLNPNENPFVKYSAIFYGMLTGKDIDPCFTSHQYGIVQDLERITSTLKMVDDRYGSSIKKTDTKMIGFGWGKEWDILYLRMKYQVPIQMVGLVTIPNIGKVYAEKLYNSGIKKKKDFFDIGNKSKVIKIIGEKRYSTILNSVILKGKQEKIAV